MLLWDTGLLSSQWHGEHCRNRRSPGCSLDSNGPDRYYSCVLCLGRVGKHHLIMAYKKDPIPCQKTLMLSVSAYQIQSNSLHSQQASATSLGLAASLGLPVGITSLTHHQTTQRSGAVILSRPWAFGNTDLEFGNVNNLYCMFFKTVFLCHE